MAVTPTPGQQEYLYDNGTGGRANVILDLYELVHFDLDGCMRILTMLIASVGLVGNSTVLWLLGFHIQRNPFSVYILNLAAADALFLCCVFLMSLALLFNFYYLYVKLMVLFFLTDTFYTVGLSLLAAISTERCLSGLFPIWYRCRRPKYTSAVVCAVLWTLDFLFCLLYTFVENARRYGRVLCFAGKFIVILWLTLLIFVLCVSSLTLLLRVQCSSQRRQPRRLYLLVLLTVLVFLVCGLAPLIAFVSELFIGHFIPLWLPWLLACVNSSANPLIYFFLGSQRHKRREPLRVLLQRALADDEEVGRESGDIPCTHSLETSS